MSKYKNRFAAKNLNRDSEMNKGSLSTQQSSDKQEANTPAEAKKHISGIWPLIIFFGLLVLVFILGLLTT